MHSLVTSVDQGNVAGEICSGCVALAGTDSGCGERPRDSGCGAHEAASDASAETDSVWGVQEKD
jgi:hypothetical protein